MVRRGAQAKGVGAERQEDPGGGAERNGEVGKMDLKLSGLGFTVALQTLEEICNEENQIEDVF